MKRCDPPAGREFFIDNLLVRIHFIIVMIRWTGLALWEFEYPFPGSLTSAFLVVLADLTDIEEVRSACKFGLAVTNPAPIRIMRRLINHLS